MSWSCTNVFANKYQGSVEAVGFCATHPWVATAGTDGALKVWDSVSGTCRHTCTHPAGVTKLEWHPAAPVSGFKISVPLARNNVTSLLLDVMIEARIKRVVIRFLVISPSLFSSPAVVSYLAGKMAGQVVETIRRDRSSRGCTSATCPPPFNVCPGVIKSLEFLQGVRRTQRDIE